MKIIDLTTDRCIVTGRKAKYFRGHVLVKAFAGRPIKEMSIISIPLPLTAGFKSKEVAEAFSFGENGYAGEWKPADGIRVEDSWDDE